MATIGLFYGSDEGNTQRIAEQIVAQLEGHEVIVADIADATQLDFMAFDRVILGISTWDFGQIQSDWEEFWSDMEAVDMTGKTVALYGLGDQFGYGDFFLDAMGMLHDVVVANGAHVVGHWPTAGYEFDASKALIEGEAMFVGLGIDEDQQAQLTSDRVAQWCAQLRVEMDLDDPGGTSA